MVPVEQILVSENQADREENWDFFSEMGYSPLFKNILFKN